MVVQGTKSGEIKSGDASRFIQRAIELAVENVKAGGGPFGAIVVRDGKIIGEGANRVTRDFDPTAHAEVIALRAACQQERQFHLPDCVIYTSCEPCPMCLAASYWAHIPTVYYAAGAESAAAAGFGDAFLYEQFRLPRDEREIELVHLDHSDADKAFREWCNNTARVNY